MAMQPGVFTILTCLACLACAPAHAQFPNISSPLISSTYIINLQTRLGYLNCNAQRQQGSQTQVISCMYPDDTEVPHETLVELGLVDSDEEETDGE